MTKQIERCYASNRRYKSSVHCIVSSYSGRLKQRFQTILKESTSWKIDFQEKYVTELYPLSSLVYLSSDSPNILTELNSDKVYIIGGLIDRNRHKVNIDSMLEELSLC
jgi:tRNA (guanine9-N1)-methyltransferase